MVLFFIVPKPRLRRDKEQFLLPFMRRDDDERRLYHLLSICMSP
jgi:hypothetical protein